MKAPVAFVNLRKNTKIHLNPSEKHVCKILMLTAFLNKLKLKCQAKILIEHIELYHKHETSKQKPAIFHLKLTPFGI